MHRVVVVVAVVAALAAGASPAQAGTRPTRSLVGGTTVSAGWPWAVFLVNQHTGGTCSGALIATKTVATAAHCVVDGTAPGDLFVTHDRAPDLSGGTGFVAGTAIRVIPSFVSGDLNSPDVAKVRLASQPASSAPLTVINRTLSSEVTGSAKALAGGYGLTSTSDTTDPVLREAVFTSLTLGGCGGFPSRFICSETGPPATCSGDSGGPLIVRLGADTVSSGPSASNGAWRLAGITHAGDVNCAGLSTWASLLDQTQHDFLQPDTTITSGPSGNTTKRTATFGFASHPAGAILQCSLDGAAYKTCTSPHKTGTLAFGSHTFRVRANSDGVVDPTPAARTFKVVRP
jgi:secreted trypsin-like serine protease